MGGRGVGGLLWYHERPRGAPPASGARQDPPGACPRPDAEWSQEVDL